MFPQMTGAYDRAITVFNPEGRLLQVEYAVTATKQTPIAMGIRCQDGVVLMALRMIVSPLTDPTEKISKVDEHVGAIAAGLMGDGMVLIDRCRLDAQIFRLTYNDVPPVKYLTKKIAEYKQLHTLYAGSRPFGVMIILGGVDDKPQLFQTHPGGAYFSYKVAVVGEGKEKAMEYFKENYKEELKIEDAIVLGLKAIQIASGEKPSSDRIEIAVISMADKKFRKLGKEEIESFISKVE